MAKTKTDPLKVEDNARNQVIAFLECSGTSIPKMTEAIRQKTGATLTPAPVYSWVKWDSSIKMENLELIINYMREMGYIFQI